MHRLPSLLRSCVGFACLLTPPMPAHAEDHVRVDVAIQASPQVSVSGVASVLNPQPSLVPPLPDGAPAVPEDRSAGDVDLYINGDDEPLPSLAEELWLHGGSYLYEPEGDRLQWPDECSSVHVQVLRLPENWCKPLPWTAFQQFLGSDPIHPRPGLQWFGEDGFQWEPRFVGYGGYELFGIVYEEGDRRQDGIGQQLLVDLDLRLTGTERFHVQFRPLGKKNTGGSFLQLNDPAGYDDNATLIPDRFWFEGEIYSLFGGVVDDPFKPRDVHVVVGKFPFVLQNSLLINDDITGIAVNKNTLLIPPFSNVNVQGFYALDDVDALPDASADVGGVNLYVDWRHAYVEATYAYLRYAHDAGLNAQYAAASVTQFFGTLTLAGRALFKWGDRDGAGDGQLYVLESNFTRYFSEQFAGATGIPYGVFYANAFKATSGWTPISGGNFDRLRSTFVVDPLISISTGLNPEETQGAAAGVQLFRHHEDESLIPEIAYERPDGTSVWGIGLQYLRKIGPRTYLQAAGVKTWSPDDDREREGIFISTFVIF